MCYRPRHIKTAGPAKYRGDIMAKMHYNVGAILCDQWEGEDAFRTSSAFSVQPPAAAACAELSEPTSLGRLGKTFPGKEIKLAPAGNCALSDGSCPALTRRQGTLFCWKHLLQDEMRDQLLRSSHSPPHCHRTVASSHPVTFMWAG